MERNLTTGSVFRSRALDCLFMGILDLGPSGAALGTTLSRALSMVLSLVLICIRRSPLRLSSPKRPGQAAAM